MWMTFLLSKQFYNEVKLLELQKRWCIKCTNGSANMGEQNKKKKLNKRWFISEASLIIEGQLK